VALDLASLQALAFGLGLSLDDDSRFFHLQALHGFLPGLRRILPQPDPTRQEDIGGTNVASVMTV
jgi:hypothetical protein